jgi:predicted ABC-type transport system involved in lysophospholipase L1 biosynthesis ATPase subunit
MTETPPVAQLIDVVRQYGSGPTAVRAIDGASLLIMPGQRVALVGPSGAGKSTLLSLLGLIDRADEGEVSLAGQSANDLPEDARADLRRGHIGFVFQLFHLIPALSALENVAVPLLPYAPRRPIMARAERLLVDLGLGDRLRNRPGELSGGEQQRVGIARALIAEPDLVLADEPTGNLDSRTAAQVVDLLLGLQEQRGFALVVATHDAGLAARLVRSVELLDGRMLATSPACRDRWTSSTAH